MNTRKELLNGERQVSPELSGIRNDHRARYAWARALLPEGSAVLDAGCGVGYGSKMLADKGHHVLGLDYSPHAVEYQRTYYAHDNVICEVHDLHEPLPEVPDVDATIAFEVLEHLDDPVAFLKNLPGNQLFVSVPNEEFFPYSPAATWHVRHYHEAEFAYTLHQAGWKVHRMQHQRGPESAVSATPGRTLVAWCIRTGLSPDAPSRVDVCALGPSLADYVELTKRLGSRWASADECWTINGAGGVLLSDCVFHMDDLRIQKARAEGAVEGNNLSNMLEWMRHHPGPIYTCYVDDELKAEFPGIELYPLASVVHDLGVLYFNNTVPYALALAIHKGVRSVRLWGCDYTYPNSHHAEQGRACLEFWCGVARSHGVQVTVPSRTTLLDSLEGLEASLYGYRDGATFEVEPTNDISFTPREQLPTADEINARYDHSKHPNQLIRNHQDGSETE